MSIERKEEEEKERDFIVLGVILCESQSALCSVRHNTHIAEANSRVAIKVDFLVVASPIVCSFVRLLARFKSN